MNSFHNPDRLVFRQSIYTAPLRIYSVEEATTIQQFLPVLLLQPIESLYC